MHVNKPLWIMAIGKFSSVWPTLTFTLSIIGPIVHVFSGRRNRRKPIESQRRTWHNIEWKILQLPLKVHVKHWLNVFGPNVRGRGFAKLQYLLSMCLVAVWKRLWTMIYQTKILPNNDQKTVSSHRVVSEHVNLHLKLYLDQTVQRELNLLLLILSRTCCFVCLFSRKWLCLHRNKNHL